MTGADSISAVLQLILQADDQATGPIQALGAAIGKLGGPLLAPVQAAAAAVGSLAGLGVTAFGVLKTLAEGAMDFEFRMAGVQAVLGASASEFAALSDEALRLGRITIFNAEEAAQALEILVKQGITYDEIMDGAGEATLNLAAAMDADLNTAAGVAAAAMNVFGLRGDDMLRAVDGISGAVNRSAINLTDMRFALQQGGQAAHAAGMSFEDVTAAVGIFGRAGIRGERAGTGLRMLMLNLIPTTAKQAEEFRKLGWTYEKEVNGALQECNIFFDEQTGKIKGLDEVARIFRTTLKDLKNDQRMHTLEVLFGARAMQFANILFEEGANGVQRFKRLMGEVTALDVARQRLDNVKGAVELLKGEWETLTITLGLTLAPTAQRIVEWGEGFLHSLIPIVDLINEIFAPALETLLARVDELIGKPLTKAFEPLAAQLAAITNPDPQQIAAEWDRVSQSLGPKFAEITPPPGEFTVDTVDAEEKMERLKKAAKEVLEDLLGEDVVWALGAMAKLLRTAAEILHLLGHASAKFQEWTGGNWAVQLLEDLRGLVNLGGAAAGALNGLYEAGKKIGDRLWGDKDQEPIIDAEKLRANVEEATAILGRYAADSELTLDGLGVRLGEITNTTYSGMSSTVSTKSAEMAQTSAARQREMEEETTTRWGAIKERVTQVTSEIAQSLTSWWLERTTEWAARLLELYTQAQTKLAEIRVAWETKLGEIRDALTTWWQERQAAAVENFNTLLANTRNSLQQKALEWRTRYEEIRQTVQEKKEAIRAIIITKLNEIIAGVRSWFVELLREWGTRLAQLVTVVAQKCAEMRSRAESWRARIGQAFVDIGKEIVAGLKKGIKDKWKSFTDWLGDKLNQARSIANSIFDIGSPSRVFFKIGWLVAAGFELGFVQKFDQATMKMLAMLQRFSRLFGEEVEGEQMLDLVRLPSWMQYRMPSWMMRGEGPPPEEPREVDWWRAAAPPRGGGGRLPGAFGEYRHGGEAREPEAPPTPQEWAREFVRVIREVGWWGDAQPARGAGGTAPGAFGRFGDEAATRDLADAVRETARELARIMPEPGWWAAGQPARGAGGILPGAFGEYRHGVALERLGPPEPDEAERAAQRAAQRWRRDLDRVGGPPVDDYEARYDPRHAEEEARLGVVEALRSRVSERELMWRILGSLERSALLAERTALVLENYQPRIEAAVLGLKEGAELPGGLGALPFSGEGPGGGDWDPLAPWVKGNGAGRVLSDTERRTLGDDLPCMIRAATSLFEEIQDFLEDHGRGGRAIGPAARGGPPLEPPIPDVGTLRSRALGRDDLRDAIGERIVLQPTFNITWELDGMQIARAQQKTAPLTSQQADVHIGIGK